MAFRHIQGRKVAHGVGLLVTPFFLFRDTFQGLQKVP